MNKPYTAAEIREMDRAATYLAGGDARWICRQCLAGIHLSGDYGCVIGCECETCINQGVTRRTP